MYNEQDQLPQGMTVEHIFEILNDVKTAKLPVSDAVDSLAYWYHEAFQTGEINVEEPSEADLYDGEDLWT
ncbi:hypothetical protein CIG75_10820 [Tumebacillus algifaecis]|uniref:Uncharacterized protein n=1 Tax=Tumebacillus algifaecis TaxID=1214604 RepID=A0A223D1J4_9BACL|nr:hypothetical protein [Tumebacillus algifaecis]ASS75421.1 hypothetical protein CIG75_10820 [Tumebacillus algifaecis]